MTKRRRGTRRNLPSDRSPHRDRIPAPRALVGSRYPFRSRDSGRTRIRGRRSGSRRPVWLRRFFRISGRERGHLAARGWEGSPIPPRLRPKEIARNASRSDTKTELNFSDAKSHLTSSSVAPFPLRSSTRIDSRFHIPKRSRTAPPLRSSSLEQSDL